MNLYVETSAVAAWLLEEERGHTARFRLAEADAVHTSDLTLIECDRALRRAVEAGRITADQSLLLQELVDTASAHWTLHAIDAEVVHRSRRSFPCEPVRALDAIHLATALVVRSLRPDVRILSFDRRVRDNAVSLGFASLPEPAGEMTTPSS